MTTGVLLADGRTVTACDELILCPKKTIGIVHSQGPARHQHLPSTRSRSSTTPPRRSWPLLLTYLISRGHSIDGKRLCTRGGISWCLEAQELPMRPLCLLVSGPYQQTKALKLPIALSDSKIHSWLRDPSLTDLRTMSAVQCAVSEGVLLDVLYAPLPGICSENHNRRKTCEQGQATR